MSENPADVKAAKRMAKLYDAILRNNEYPSEKELHTLNVFLCRLLFCYFAEDTGIFDQNAFTNSVSSHTQEDGGDLDQYLNKLFEVLNIEDHSSYPKFLASFPYVNGGLFSKKLAAPKFSRKSRRILIECGRLNWSAINPDIFGSMIQAVVHPDQRGGLGMHYTSVPNIMKVIDSLFLNELKGDFEKYYDDEIRLNRLLARFGRIRIFDPACGSGNFLIIAYKEMRRLEMEVFQRIQKITKSPSLPFLGIYLSQFYGIELDDFAHEIAILSLWLAEHQMNLEFKEIFGRSKPALPLKESGNIVHDNATRIDWEIVCPINQDYETFILGNPPYLGSGMQDKEQKEDIGFVFKGISGFKNLDYISCWFLKGALYISGKSAEFAFVSTNSICQGQQVSLLWPYLLKMNLEIRFAYTSFKWSNSARANAGVSCAIIGVRNKTSKSTAKKIFSNGISHTVENISPYLISGKNIFATKRSRPISNIKEMENGSKAADGGNLIFQTEEEKKSFLSKYPEAECYIKELAGSKEFIKGSKRWCLWINDTESAEAMKIPGIRERVGAVKKFRLNSRKAATRKFANSPYRFAEIRYKATSALLIPAVSSERREYIPIGFLDPKVVVVAPNFAIFDCPPLLFSILSSKMHMVWVRAVAGRLKTDYRYSSALCYNTLPLPELTEKQKETITAHTYNILEEREANPKKTMAELYDPKKMPEGLRKAHDFLDEAVERCYRSKPFANDDERLEHLFKLYEEMTKRNKAEA